MKKRDRREGSIVEKKKRPIYRESILLDIKTVIRKEWKEHIIQRGSIRNFGILGTLLLILSFGIFLPLQFGEEWITSPDLLVYWAWVPLFLVINTIADSIAGERERKTLETLLSTCLSNRGILLGKIGAAILYAYISLLLILCIGILNINLFIVKEGFLLYPLSTMIIILVFSLLANILVAILGVLVSLRSKTVRQAQQGLSLAVMLLLFTPLFGYQYLPSTVKMRIHVWISRIGLNQLVLLILSLLLLLNIGLLLFTDARFKREKIDLL